MRWLNIFWVSLSSGPPREDVTPTWSTKKWVCAPSLKYWIYHNWIFHGCPSCLDLQNQPYFYWQAGCRSFWWKKMCVHHENGQVLFEAKTTQLRVLRWLRSLAKMRIHHYWQHLIDWQVTGAKEVKIGSHSVPKYYNLWTSAWPLKMESLRKSWQGGEMSEVVEWMSFGLSVETPVAPSGCEVTVLSNVQICQSLAQIQNKLNKNQLTVRLFFITISRLNYLGSHYILDLKMCCFLKIMSYFFFSSPKNYVSHPCVHNYTSAVR